MRTHSIYCDWCKVLIEDVVTVVSYQHLKAFATWDGARYDFDFCSHEHLQSWQDWNSMDRIGCGFKWVDREHPGHTHVCKDTRNCLGNHGKWTEVGWDRDCWCGVEGCESHRNRPRDWVIVRAAEYLQNDGWQRLEILRKKFEGSMWVSGGS